MADRLLGEFEEKIDRLTLIPAANGKFEVVVDGDLVYSKLGTGRHAEYDDVAEPIRSRA